MKGANIASERIMQKIGMNNISIPNSKLKHYKIEK